MQSKLLKKLEDKKQKYEKIGVYCKNKIIKGNPKDIIIKYVHEQEIDLVVI